MLAEQFQLFAWFYVNPKRAASGVLDRGRFWFAVLAAAAVTLAVGVGADGLMGRDYGEFYRGGHEELVRLAQTGQTLSPEMAEAMARIDQQRRALESRYLLSRFNSVLLMAAVFLPACVLLLAAFCHLGSGLTVLFRDYQPALAGSLFAWAAARLPVALLWWSGVPAAWVVPVQIAALLYFLLLMAVVLSTVMGVSFWQALLAELPSVALGAGASLLLTNSGNLLYFLASPWLLYFGYQRFGGDLSALGGGLAARQNFKRQLEFATLNPRDADAHYQLGLLYVQRRSLDEAEKSFRRALAIDPNEPETLYHLGRLLRQKGGHEAEAQDLLERAAHLDAKVAGHQVWRELGALALSVGQPEEALKHLAYFVQVREYDPEGLVHYGRALRRLDRSAEARAAFEKAIEAARAAPKFRRSELAPWERQARQELKA